MNKYVTSRGVEIEFVPIAGLAAIVEVQNPLPDPPTYSKMTAGKVLQTFPHDETTLEVEGDPEQTAKNRTDWLDYLERKEQAIERRNRMRERVTWLRGVQVEMPADEAWVKAQEELGIHVPSDAQARKIHWIKTEAMGSAQDIEKINHGIELACGFLDKEVKEAEDSFRDPLGEPGGETAAGSAPT